jgi:transcriptional regulator with XRE-family HTH domain
MNELADRLAVTLDTLLSLRQMTRTEVAEKAGMSPSQISHYLSGRTLPQLAQLERLAGALDVDLLTVFYTMSKIDEVRKRLEVVGQSGELRDPADDVILLREGALLVKHPLSEVVDAINHLHDYIRDLQLALATRHERPTRR